MAALTDRYSLQQLCDLAAEKDAGVDPRVLADAMNAATDHPDDAFAELGLSEEATQRLRTRAHEWRAMLLAGNLDETLPSPATHPRATASGRPATSNPSPPSRA